ncbi:MAG: AsmA-like C-terminal region-containing protein, partial [Gammaproteobacteria bacterium]|nr:AsmA-like C-terminal region-containing protein [Gammaproteobacteria bacterium]
TLRKLNVNGKLLIKEMKSSNVRSQDTSITLKANNGLITMYPLSAKMYDGTYHGNIRVDARNSVPLISMDEKLAGVQIGKLLKDFSGKDTLTGTTNFNLKLAARGANTDAIRKDLNGNASFAFKDGKLKGVDNVKEIMNTLSMLRGITPDTTSSSNETAFSSLTGSMKFTNGVGTNNDLLLDSPILKITGAGNIDLVKEWVNYKAKAILAKDFQMEGFKESELNKIRGKSIPVAINCSLKAIDANCFKYSLEDLIKDEIENKIKDQLFKKFSKPQPAAPTTTEPAPAAQPAQEQPVDPKKQLENDLKKKLLKGLFN